MMDDDENFKDEELDSIDAVIGEGPSVHVGEILLRELKDGSIWMEQADGEGMQVKGLSLTRLEAQLQGFYDENF